LTSAERAVEARPIAWYWYLAAFIGYVALGYFFKSVVLNWIVGPLWLLLWLSVIPRGLRGLGTPGKVFRR